MRLVESQGRRVVGYCSGRVGCVLRAECGWDERWGCRWAWAAVRLYLNCESGTSGSWRTVICQESEEIGAKVLVGSAG